MSNQRAEPRNRLRELRMERGLKVYDVAAIVRRETTMVYDYERGKYPVPASVLEALCRHYGVTAEYLLGWDRDQEGAAA